MCNAECNASSTLRGVLELADDFLGLLPCFNAGNHNAASADIKNAGKGGEIQIGDARHGDDAAAAAGRDHLFHQANVAAPVFHVEDHEVHSAGIEHGSDAGREELKKKLTKQSLALL